MRARLLFVVGLVGLLEILAPRPVVGALTRLAYRGADDAEPRGWLPVAVRAEGAVLVAVALGGLYGTARDGD